MTEEVIQQLGGRVPVQLLQEYIHVKQTALTTQPNQKRRATRQTGLRKRGPNVAKKLQLDTELKLTPPREQGFFVCVCNRETSDLQLNKDKQNKTPTSHERKWKNSTAFLSSLGSLCASISDGIWHFLYSPGWLEICFQLPQYNLQLIVPLC